MEIICGVLVAFFTFIFINNNKNKISGENTILKF